VTQIKETPHAWNSQESFLQQVGLKLYMFVPAIVAGTLLSISFWILAMIVLRTYGLLRNKIFGAIKIVEDVEMCNHNNTTVKTVNNYSRQESSESFDGHGRDKSSKFVEDKSCDNSPSKLLKTASDEKLSSSSRSCRSFHSSPVSMSSGIGVSERDSGDERDREKCQDDTCVARDTCHCYCQIQYNDNIYQDNSRNR